MGWDNVWEKVFSEQEWGKYPAESLIRFIARNFYKKDRKNVKILEIGCGPGANIWYLSREGFDTYGIEGSQTAVERAKIRLKSDNLNADIIKGDILKLPYKDNHFDAVIDVECIYSNSLHDSEIILREVQRVLKNGGLFYSRTFSNNMYIGKSRDDIGEMEYSNISDGPFEGKGFARLMDKAAIDNLYGAIFEVLSVDKLEETQNNGARIISEWVIISRNK